MIALLFPEKEDRKKIQIFLLIQLTKVLWEKPDSGIINSNVNQRIRKEAICSACTDRYP